MRPSWPAMTAVLVVMVSSCTSGPNQDRKAPHPSGSAAVPVSSRQLLGAWGLDPTVDPEHRTPWLRFEANGTFGGSDGCNSVGGRWTLADSTGALRLEELATTDVACPGSEILSLTGVRFDGAKITYAFRDGHEGSLSRQTS